MDLHGLLSPQWYRVANLRPRLRSGVTVTRQQVRGEIWYVLSDTLTGSHHRFSARAHDIVAACDGRRRIDDIWAAQLERLGDDAPAQADVIAVLGQAYAANLLTGDTPKDARIAMNLRQRRRRADRATAAHPLAFKVPLGNPDAWLQRLDGIAARVFSRTGWLAALLMALIGAAFMAWNAVDVQAEARLRWGESRLLWSLWLAYPVIKLVHELAHALAVRAYGGSVPEIGIQLLMLTPAPYVDASASAAFAHRARRVGVAAAGVAAEWALATLALGAWVMLEPGWARDLALAICLIGGLSTLLVNGNPLVRFDGYHVLCDALELPNLAMRSARWWRERAQVLVAGAPVPQPLLPARGETKWLWLYAPASWLYRTALLLGLALLAAHWQPFAGLALLGYAAWASVFGPAFRALMWLADADLLHRRRGRAAAFGLAASGVASLLLFVVPVPRVTHAAGVVVLPDEALVRPATEGFIATLLARDGDTVAPGQVLLRLTNEPLRLAAADADRLAREARLESRMAFGIDPVRWAREHDRAQALEADAERLAARVAALDVRAQVGGRLVLDAHRLAPGQHVGQGDTLAQILTPGAPRVRALVDGSVIGDVGAPSVTARVALADERGDGHPAVLEHAPPRATHALPSAALGQAFGGPFVLDADDRTGRTAAEPRFALELRLPDETPARIGMRALVTFDLGQASLASQFARAMRRALLRHFDQ